MKQFSLFMALAICGIAFGQTHQVTFEVNMANETVAASGVYLAGGADFGVPGDNPMTDDDGDGIYSITVELADGYSGYYAFTNGLCPDWSCKESLVGQPCGDPANYNDRFIENVVSDTTLSTCFAQCSTDGTCSAPEDPVDVTFNVDMNTTAIAGPIYITGLAIDNWCGNCVEMFDEDGDGVYSLTLQLEPGTYEYRYNNGGWSGQEELTPEDDADCTLTTGAFTNRIVTVPGGAPFNIETNCFSTCGACTGDPVDPTTSEVTLAVDMSQEDILGPIYVTGNTIDNWCGTCVEMLDEDADDIYTVTVELGLGDHEYKFNNGGWDGQEMLDETEDADCTLTTDGFTNRLLNVSDSLAIDVPAVCFNSCAACIPDGVDELNGWDFTVAPSVTDGVFTLRFGQNLARNARLAVHRIDGGLVHEQNLQAGTSTLVLDASAWENGVYLINCADGVSGSIERLIKIQ